MMAERLVVLAVFPGFTISSSCRPFCFTDGFLKDTENPPGQSLVRNPPLSQVLGLVAELHPEGLGKDRNLAAWIHGSMTGTVRGYPPERMLYA
jgi:hypothetical protein